MVGKRTEYTINDFRGAPLTVTGIVYGDPPRVGIHKPQYGKGWRLDLLSSGLSLNGAFLRDFTYAEAQHVAKLCAARPNDPMWRIPGNSAEHRVDIGRLYDTLTEIATETEVYFGLPDWTLRRTDRVARRA